MNYEHFLDRIAAARGKEIPKVTIAGIYRLFDQMQEKDIEHITRLIEKYENVPSNLYGLVDRLWSERKYWLDQQTMNTDNWKADPDNASGAEFSAFMAVMTEILTWHDEKLIQRNPEGLTVAMDIHEWKRAGCPKTWSELLDKFLTGYLKMITASSNSGLLLEYMIKFKNNIHDERIKRTFKE